MNETVPKLSIGLAVRNGRDVIERCINSILSQDFSDFELIICECLRMTGRSRDSSHTPTRIYASAVCTLT